MNLLHDARRHPVVVQDRLANLVRMINNADRHHLEQEYLEALQVNNRLSGNRMEEYQRPDDRDRQGHLPHHGRRTEEYQSNADDDQFLARKLRRVWDLLLSCCLPHLRMPFLFKM